MMDVAVQILEAARRKECWYNVYGIAGYYEYSRHYSYNIAVIVTSPGILYRIHVRLK